MPLKDCPQCEFQSYEIITLPGKCCSYAVCHNCDYSTIEARQEPTLGTQSASNEDMPNPLSGMDLVMNEPPTQGSLFSAADYKILREAINGLPTLQKNILYLKFWKNLPDMSIAYFLNIRFTTVQTSLNEAYAKLKEACISHQKFSKCVTHNSSFIPVAA